MTTPFIDPRYPHGKLNDADEGALQMALGHESGRVILRFGEPVAWVGMTAQGAADLAQALIQHARAAAPGEAFTLTIGGDTS